jgi:nucleoside-diphosphate-sugar epimerase
MSCYNRALFVEEIAKNVWRKPQFPNLKKSRINTGIILNATEWLRMVKLSRVLFASSSENYAATTDTFNYPVPVGKMIPLCIVDTRPLRFTCTVTKILSEAVFFAYGKKLGIHTAVVQY